MVDYKMNLQEFLTKELESKKRIEILEAGCGSLQKITFEKEVYITGFDISQKQLDRNIYLNKKILGDLQKFDFERDKFDLIICWDVLEHLPKPKLALDNMSKALKPGGLMVLKLPNLMSFKGLFTRFSPHSIHVLYYKLVYKQPNAGKDDTGPFKTFLKFAVAPNSLKRYAKSRGLKVVRFELMDVSDEPYFFIRTKHRKLLLALYKAAKTLSIILSFGYLGGSEVAIVFQK
jgi:SAM-dependent methyltransferase